MKKKKKAINYIEENLKLQGRNRKWLAAQLDISPRTLYNLLQQPLKDWEKPRLEVLERLQLTDKPSNKK